MEIFSYLSVLVSIIIGLGMSHLLKAVVRLIHNRARVKIYSPTLLWAANLFLLFTLLWWADYQLNRHTQWTFSAFFCTLSLPTVLYVVSGLVMPWGDSSDIYDMREAYFTNRMWLLSLFALAVALSFLQTYLLDGFIRWNFDAWLKMGLIAVTLVPLFAKNEKVQYAAAAVNLTWIVAYIALLFSNLRTG